MSRAFVKEPDGDGVAGELPELPISPHRNLVTKRGLRLMEETIARLQAALKKEEEENPVRLARDLRYWTARRATAELVPAPADTSQVRFGLRVTLEREDGTRAAYRIVGQDEADPTQELLSYVSPLARALIGKRAGDVVAMGEQGEAEIMEISQ